MTQQVLNVVPSFHEGLLTSNHCYSFMNFASLTSFFGSTRTVSQNVKFFCDGALMAMAVRLLTGKTVQRVSFDYTSIAPQVFDYAARHKIPVFVVGAEQSELESFITKVRLNHPDLVLAGSQNGYFSQDGTETVYAGIIASKAGIVVAGLGAGKQEEFLCGLHASGYQGVSFSCGGFIRQEATAVKQYYPVLINKLGLRAFYRMYREPHTIRRYALDYPKNFLYLLSHFARRKLAIVIDGEKI